MQPDVSSSAATISAENHKNPGEMLRSALGDIHDVSGVVPGSMANELPASGIADPSAGLPVFERRRLL